jgi:importin subunit beta-1
MKDPVVYVKDTTAWTIGRVCQLHAEAVLGILPSLIAVLLESLGDSPQVSSNVCWVESLGIVFNW